MIEGKLKMKWNKEANLSNEDKKEIKTALMGAMFPSVGFEMLWHENARLKKLLKK